jgi:hypothetical protein
MFDAFCRIGANYVFPDFPLKGVKSLLKDEDNRNGATEAVDPFKEIPMLYGRAGSLLGELALAKPIKRDDLNSAIDQIEKIGTALRAQLDEVSARVEGANKGMDESG